MLITRPKALLRFIISVVDSEQTETRGGEERITSGQAKERHFKLTCFIRCQDKNISET